MNSFIIRSFGLLKTKVSEPLGSENSHCGSVPAKLAASENLDLRLIHFKMIKHIPQLIETFLSTEQTYLVRYLTSQTL